MNNKIDDKNDNDILFDVNGSGAGAGSTTRKSKKNSNNNNNENNDNNENNRCLSQGMHSLSTECRMSTVNT